MLFDPKWNKPSMEGLARFCEGKAANETYVWSNSESCACAQYFNAMGLSKQWHVRFRSGSKHGSLMVDLDLIAIKHQTFGDLAKALRREIR